MHLPCPHCTACRPACADEHAVPAEPCCEDDCCCDEHAPPSAPESPAPGEEPACPPGYPCPWCSPGVTPLPIAPDNAVNTPPVSERVLPISNPLCADGVRSTVERPPRASR